MIVGRSVEILSLLCYSALCLALPGDIEEMMISADLVHVVESVEEGKCGGAGVPAGGVKVQGVGEVTYACNDGYMMMGERTRSCMSNGSWSGTPPLCSKILLPDNTATLHTVYTGQSLAHRQAAVQSSTLAYHSPGLAVDGGNISYQHH